MSNELGVITPSPVPWGAGGVVRSGSAFCAEFSFFSSALSIVSALSDPGRRCSAC